MNRWNQCYWLSAACSLLMAAGGCANDRSCRGGSCGVPSQSSSTYAAPAYSGSGTVSPAYGAPAGSDTGVRDYMAPSYEGSGTR